MATRLANLLVVVFLCATCVRAEEEIELDMSDMEASEKTILTVADAETTDKIVIQLFIMGALVTGYFVLIRELGLAALTRIDIELLEKTLLELFSSRSDYFDEPPSFLDYPDYSGYSSYSSYSTDGSYRSLGHGKSFLGRILNSIDLMDVTFGVMDVEDDSCRRRAVCELQRAASRMPFLGSFLENISPSINGMAKYKEAQQSGSALEDCKLLFECPYSFLETN
ncbi:uncharacterized protein LOC122262586 isoform X1 [Penaeus japonicus]|uniref:uncharacterized protein LOC122262586 isoform X1 n=1 Tax=Penaeus japonicus TaxID=27405 RepID=UPI001C716025|nr:uncharacterized protein LOC122262586 isoform X1 [Penaeus japonicus]XP_042886556.1 uncharacterized protein LOC122262586 isoform X1 [Penaeus japonicus]